MMEVKKDKIIDILSKVRAGLLKKSFVDHSNCFIFTGQEVLAYNDCICVLHPFKTPFTCCVPADELLQIVTGIYSDEIEFSFEKEKIFIATENIKAVLATCPIDDIQKRIEHLLFLKAVKKKKPLPENFAQAMSLCLASVSKDMSNVALAAILVEDKYVASTDRVRITEYKMSASIDDMILIPATSAAELLKFDAKYFYIDKSWAYFIDDENAIFALLLLNEEFPDYVKHLKGFDAKKIILPEKMKQGVDSALILADGDYDLDKQIIVEIDKGKVKVKSQNDKGSIIYNCDIDYVDDKLTFVINPYSLSQILLHTNTMFYGDNKVMFQGESFKHVIAVMPKEYGDGAA